MILCMFNARCSQMCIRRVTCCHNVFRNKELFESICCTCNKKIFLFVNSNSVHTEKCPIYLHIPWIGNVSMKFEKQITSVVKCCFFSVEPRVIFTTRQLLPATKKDVLPSHHQNNVIYQFVCHCDSRYVGRTSQRFDERIK